MISFAGSSCVQGFENVGKTLLADMAAIGVVISSTTTAFPESDDVVFHDEVICIT